MSKLTCPTCRGTGKVPDTRAEVKRLLEKGESQAAIGRELGVSRARVNQIRHSLIERGEIETEGVE